jgi:hypothetical protein
MKTGRISAITAAGIMAAGALTVIAGTGTASAASYSNLCVNSTTGYGTECADSELGTGAGNWIITLSYGSSNLTNWTYPTGATPAAIRQADNVNYCMQFDETGNESSPLNYQVIGATCNNDEAEMWWNVYDPESGRTLFESEWAYYNLDYEQVCLTYGPGDGDSAGLFATPCNFSGNSSYWYQQWGTS